MSHSSQGSSGFNSCNKCFSPGRCPYTEFTAIELDQKNEQKRKIPTKIQQEKASFPRRKSFIVKGESLKESQRIFCFFSDNFVGSQASVIFFDVVCFMPC